MQKKKEGRRGEKDEPFNTILLIALLFALHSLLEELVECWSEFFEIVEWHAEAAGCSYLVDVYAYDCACAGDCLYGLGLYDFAFSVSA